MRTTTIEINEKIYAQLKNELRKGNKLKATTVFISILPEETKDLYGETEVIITNLTKQK